MGTMDQRLQVLERELSRSRRTNQLLGIAIVVVVCIAGARGNTPDPSKPPKQPSSSDAGPSAAKRPLGGHPARIVEADEFVLTDGLGRPRIRMQVTDSGPAISMFDEAGQKRLELGQTSGASGLSLFGSGEPVVALQLEQHGDRARLEIRSAQGSAMMKSDGFSVQDASNQGRLNLSLLNGNYAVLGMSQSGQTGPPSIELTAGEASRSLKIHDQNGYPLFSLFTADGGKAFLNMRHPAHERLLQISTGPDDLDGPLMAFFAPANEDSTGGLLPRLQLGISGIGGDHQPHVRIVDGDGQALFTAPSEPAGPP